jgi:hypothetical protein
MTIAPAPIATPYEEQKLCHFALHSSNAEDRELEGVQKCYGIIHTIAISVFFLYKLKNE